MKLKLYLMLLFYTCFVVSCVENKDLAPCEDQLPKTHRNDVNTALQIIVPSHLNTFKAGDHIVIVVENLSQDMIDVSPGIDLKFYWDDIYRNI
jgi:hypothetical protein